MHSNTANQRERRVQDPSNQEKTQKNASTRQAAKKRGGEGAAITHFPCWLEKEPLQNFRRNAETDRSSEPIVNVYKWNKFENWFSNAVSAIFGAGDL